MINKILNLLRKINKKTFDIQFFLIPTLIRAKLQILIFHFCPKLVRFLSIKTARLPNKEERFLYNKEQLDELKIINKQNFRFESIDLYIRSKKYNFQDLEKSKNIFLLNPFYIENETTNHLPPSKKKLLMIEKKNVYYVTSDHDFLGEYLKYKINIIYIQVWKKRKKELFISQEESKLRNKALEYCKENNNSYVLDVCFETNCKTLYIGSAIIAALTFTKLTKKLNIYNWDFYMNESPKDYGYFKTLNLLYPVNFRIKNNVFLEMGLWHWVFIYRLSKLKNVQITGYLKDICGKQKIVKRLLEIFYKQTK
jgi:hypothetical protein